MSITLKGLPYFLFYELEKAIVDIKTEITSENEPIIENKFLYVDEELEKIKNVHKNRVKKIPLHEMPLEQIFNSEFETNFMDKDTLKKTLIEHGVSNINEFENAISGDYDNLHIEFYRASNSPFFMKLSCNEQDTLKEFASDITSEYKSNAQEISYNKIKERLEEKNLEIVEEEIYDDNTIVLTVNLE